jgi:ABC-type bacteriocin/lantibiotic exporter with double-glycine peptidase domain
MVNLDTVYDVLTSVEKLGKITDKQLEKNGSVQLLPEEKGLSLEMNSVNFSYDDNAGKNVLNNINFIINSNEKVCIMGNTGSGKSTLLRLLSGAYNHFGGNIFIENIPLSNYQLDSLRMQTGILLSQQDIFQGTLLENITMGNPEISPHHILNLAEKIGLKKFMSELKDGLNTNLDPIGKKLSRNIIQKILLLRALVNKPRLVLMEEPFDSISELVRESVMKYLLTEVRGQTILVSTNDENFAAQCDKVIFLDNGSIKAVGKWSEIRTIVKN